MGELATLQRGATVADTTFTPAQLQIIQKTVAPDLRTLEFDLFIEQCKIYGLNPITKQIYAIVYNKNDDKKRHVTLIPSISGLRSMASRTGRYRPDNEAARYENCEKVSENPEGLLCARVRVFVLDSQGQWYPVEDEAYWSEFALIEREWKWGDKKGERVYTGNSAPSGKWADMPRVMLAKCAEARALRKAFPEMEGLYVQEEVDRSYNDEATATEIVEAQNTLDRRALVGDKHITILWQPMGEQEAIPASELHGRLMDFYSKDVPSSDHLDFFIRANQQSLKEFWAEDPERALECKKAREAADARLKEAEQAALQTEHSEA